MDAMTTVANFLLLKGEAGARFTDIVEGLKGRVKPRMIANVLRRGQKAGIFRRSRPGGKGKRGEWYYVSPEETAQWKAERRYRGQLAGSIMKNLPAADEDPEAQAKRLAALLIVWLRSRERLHLEILGSMLSLRDIQRAVERAGSRWQLVLFDALQATADPLLRPWDDSVRAALLMRPRAAWRAIEIARNNLDLDSPPEKRKKPGRKTRRGSTT